MIKLLQRTFSSIHTSKKKLFLFAAVGATVTLASKSGGTSALTDQTAAANSKHTEGDSHIHTKIAVIGAGPGGHSVTSQLIRAGAVQGHEITVFDPRKEHHYQPAYTMIGGGVIGNATKAKSKESKYVVRDQGDMFRGSPGARWVPTGVKSFQPENNQMTLQDGSIVNYEFLVVASGLSLRWDLIPGAKEAIEDPNCPASSIFTLNGAYKTSVLRENFKGGKAIFTVPIMPIKCAGAPQKIMYLSEETFRKNGVRSDSEVHFYTTVPNLFPNCLTFADALKPIAASKNINVHLKHQLVKVDGEKRIATFKNLDSGDVFTSQFDFLHIVPPQTAPEFVSQSSLAAPNGWLDVDASTLQHNKFKNVFGLGDVANLPTSKTAAALFSQSPVVVHNLQVEMGKQTSKAKYDGYASCPLFVGDGKLMMIEFKYGGVADETFVQDQTMPKRSFYWLKKELFPFVYWNFMPKGLWYGRKVFKPKF